MPCRSSRARKSLAWSKRPATGRRPAGRAGVRETRDQAIGAVRDGGRAIFIVLQGPPAPLERGITGESFAAHVNRQRLEALRRLVEARTLRPQVEAVLPLDQAREALARVAGQHTRGKIVLQIGQ